MKTSMNFPDPNNLTSQDFQLTESRRLAGMGRMNTQNVDILRDSFCDKLVLDEVLCAPNNSDVALKSIKIYKISG